MKYYETITIAMKENMQALSEKAYNFLYTTISIML